MRPCSSRRAPRAPRARRAGRMQIRAPPPVTIGGGRRRSGGELRGRRGAWLGRVDAQRDGEGRADCRIVRRVRVSSASARTGSRPPPPSPGRRLLARREKSPAFPTVVACAGARPRVTENGTVEVPPARRDRRRRLLSPRRALRRRRRRRASARPRRKRSRNDAGPTVAAVTATAPETSSCSDTVSPALAKRRDSRRGRTGGRARSGAARRRRRGRRARRRASSGPAASHVVAALPARSSAVTHTSAFCRLPAYSRWHIAADAVQTCSAPTTSAAPTLIAGDGHALGGPFARAFVFTDTRSRQHVAHFLSSGPVTARVASVSKTGS